VVVVNAFSDSGNDDDDDETITVFLFMSPSYDECSSKVTAVVVVVGGR